MSFSVDASEVAQKTSAPIASEFETPRSLVNPQERAYL